jgi:hypothetical protein
MALPTRPQHPTFALRDSVRLLLHKPEENQQSVNDRFLDIHYKLSNQDQTK